MGGFFLVWEKSMGALKNKLSLGASKSEGEKKKKKGQVLVGSGLRSSIGSFVHLTNSCSQLVVVSQFEAPLFFCFSHEIIHLTSWNTTTRFLPPIRRRFF